jgi:choice-of-anchor B domain-containing protein
MRQRVAVLLGASLALLACGAGTGDTPTVPDLASSASGAPPEPEPGRLNMSLRAHLSLGDLVGGTAKQKHDEPEEIQGGLSGSGNWGYTHKSGRRFALTGTSAGLSIVEVTDPRQPRNIALIPTPADPNDQFNFWREVRTYRDYLYVTTEATAGLDIISMANPDAPQRVRTWNQTFNRAHTIWIDQARGLAFVNGTRMNNTHTGMRVLDLSVNPANPTEVGSFPNGSPGFYVHDSYSRGNVLFASSICQPNTCSPPDDGFLAMLDVSNPASITEISRFHTGGRFTHNSWLNDRGTVLFTTDERPGRPLEAWDIANPSAPRKLSEYIGRPGTIPHNVMVDGNRLLVSHYVEGVHLLDISNSKAPRVLGYYDTYPGTQTGFHGCWGAYIFPGSNLIVASDIEDGLFVFEYTGP